MAEVEWPSSLPQELSQRGFEYDPPDLTIREEMSLGEDKSRRRGTAGVTRVVGEMVLSRQQVETLLDFYRDTLSEGIRPFDWKDPITEADVEMKFRSRPGIRARGAAFRVTLELAILP